MSQLDPSQTVSVFLSMLVESAVSSIENFGAANPAGVAVVVKGGSGTVVFLDDLGSSDNGPSGSDMKRSLENKIRRLRMEGDVTLAITLTDMVCRHTDGTGSFEALLARCEEKDGPALRIQLPYTRLDGKVELGKQVVELVSPQLISTGKPL